MGPHNEDALFWGLVCIFPVAQKVVFMSLCICLWSSILIMPLTWSAMFLTL